MPIACIFAPSYVTLRPNFNREIKTFEFILHLQSLPTIKANIVLFECARISATLRYAILVSDHPATQQYVAISFVWTANTNHKFIHMSSDGDKVILTQAKHSNEQTSGSLGRQASMELRLDPDQLPHVPCCQRFKATQQVSTLLRSRRARCSQEP